MSDLFIVLTDVNDNGLYINPKTINVIQKATNTEGSYVYTLEGKFFAKQSPDQILDLMSKSFLVFENRGKLDDHFFVYQSIPDYMFRYSKDDGSEKDVTEAEERKEGK